MLELIGGILIVYYLVLGVAVLVFLAWGYLEEYRYEKWRRRETTRRNAAQAPTEPQPEGDPTRQANRNDRPPDNVVRFKRRE
jgi:hypothetical protein